VGIKIGLIVDGGADVYVSGSRYIKVWDTCAPAVVLQAAGGEMTGLLGERLEYTGTAAHADGVRAWTPAARGTLQPRLEAVVARFKR
jgi:3'-phosphoadenosine 5'-phosphosulfate (PAPS) 3'-phosphatase